MAEELSLSSGKSNAGPSRWWAAGSLGLTAVGLCLLGLLLAILGVRRVHESQCSPGRRKWFWAALIISSAGLILELVLVMVFMGPWIRWGLDRRGPPKIIYGKCAKCEFIQTWTYWQVAFGFPFKYGKDVGVLPRTCPQCRQTTLYRALKCPKCSKVFSPLKVCGSMYDDKCEYCYESYAKSWQEKYGK